MQELTKCEDRKNFFFQCEDKEMEDAVLITLKRSAVIIHAMAEATESGNLRVVLYHHGTGWKLSRENKKMIATEGIIAAVCEEQANRSGDLTYAYEEGGQERTYYDTVYDYMLSLLPQEEIHTVILNSTEEQTLPLEDGTYLLLLPNHKAAP